MGGEYYALYLDDPATPSFCSFSKLYVGTQDALMRVADNLKQDGMYEETAEGILTYFSGNHDVTHHIAFSELPVLEPVKVLEKAEMQLEGKSWDHINTWDQPYHMSFSSALISQLLLKEGKTYRRCISASFSELSYLGFKDEWRPVGSLVFGNASVLDIQLRADGHSSVSTILYVTEDLSDSLEEQLRKMNDPDALVFDSICDEIFGDG